jgi:hypothetical protein
VVFNEAPEARMSLGYLGKEVLRELFEHLLLEGHLAAVVNKGGGAQISKIPLNIA